MNIFKFTDYRSFLRDYISSLPKKGRGEINRMAQFAGIHPSLLSQVLAKDKNLSLEQAQLVSEWTNLTRPESEFFMTLVNLQRAGTEKLRSYFREKLQEQKTQSVELRQRVRQDRELSSEEKATFYSHWLYAAVWISTSLGTGLTLEEVRERFDISHGRAATILNFLTETGLSVLEDYRYRMGPQSIHLERGSPYLYQHHTNWRLRSVDVSDRISAEELMYTAPMSVSESDLKKIRDRLAEVVKEVTDIAIASPAEATVCFNLDFFRIRKSAD